MREERIEKSVEKKKVNIQRWRKRKRDEEEGTKNIYIPEEILMIKFQSHPLSTGPRQWEATNAYWL